MSPSRTHDLTPERPIAAWKEIRRMPHTLNRLLDTTVSVAVVCLALYLGFATSVLGVV